METRTVPLISTGDVIVVSLLKPIRYSSSTKESGRFRAFRLRRRRTKRWLVVLDRLSVFRSRFWEMRLLWGRVGWVRRTGGLVRLGLYAKYRKQLVYVVVFLGVCNTALLSVLHLVGGARANGKVSRKVLSFIPKLRSKKLKRMFPLRRMNRKFKKVK